jgi:hypothetical protein
MNTATGAVGSTVTDSDGRYGIFALPVGEHEIRAAKEGFAVERRTGVHLVVAQEATVDFCLTVGASRQQVTINANVPLKTGGLGVPNSTSGNNFAVERNRPQQDLDLLNGIEFTGAAENNMRPVASATEKG